MSILSFIFRIFKLKPVWQGSPEMFLGLVMTLQKMNNQKYSLLEVLQWGNVLQKIIKVNLKPYKDFRDLMLNGEPDFSVSQKLNEKLIEATQRIAMKKAVYGENADLGDDDVLKSNSSDSVFARNMIKNLSKYVEFSDEEKKKIDKFDK